MADSALHAIRDALARRRVPLGFLFAAVVLWLARPTVGTLRVGAAVGAVGEALRIWAAGHLNKSREVTASGPYRFAAHPLYVGSSIMGGGLAIASGSIAAAVVIGVYLIATVTAAIAREEAFLRAKFGGAYDRYRAAHPSALDRGAAGPSGPAFDRDRRFALSLALANREYRALAGFIVAVLLLVWKATYNGTFWAAVNR